MGKGVVEGERGQKRGDEVKEAREPIRWGSGSEYEWKLKKAEADKKVKANKNALLQAIKARPTPAAASPARSVAEDSESDADEQWECYANAAEICADNMRRITRQEHERRAREAGMM